MDDLIDRKVLLREMEKLYNKRAVESVRSGNHACCLTWNDAVYLVTVAPTIEAEPFNCSLEEFGECSYRETGCSDCKVKEKVRNAFNKAEQKYGRWIEDEYGLLICSECGNTAEYLPILGQIETPYCNECGARMDEVKNGD